MHQVLKFHSPTRKPAFEKRLSRIGLRCPETLKTTLDRRAAARGVTLSQHVLDLAIADLRSQQESGRTLSNAATELLRVLELARQGIDSDQQRLAVLRTVTRFQLAVLEAS